MIENLFNSEPKMGDQKNEGYKTEVKDLILQAKAILEKQSNDENAKDIESVITHLDMAVSSLGAEPDMKKENPEGEGDDFDQMKKMKDTKFMDQLMDDEED